MLCHVASLPRRSGRCLFNDAMLVKDSNGACPLRPPLPRRLSGRELSKSVYMFSHGKFMALQQHMFISYPMFTAGTTSRHSAKYTRALKKKKAKSTAATKKNTHTFLIQYKTCITQEASQQASSTHVQDCYKKKKNADKWEIAQQ